MRLATKIFKNYAGVWHIILQSELVFSHIALSGIADLF